MPSRLPKEPLSGHPGGDRSNGGLEKTSDGTCRKAGKVPRSFSRGGGDLHEQLPSRGNEPLSPIQQLGSCLACEPEGVAEQYDLPPLGGCQRWQDGVSHHLGRRPCCGRTLGTLRPSSRVQHRAREIESNATGIGTSDPREEPARAGAEIHHPRGGQPMTVQEPLAKLPEQGPLGGPLVTLQLSLGAVSIQVAEPQAARTTLRALGGTRRTHAALRQRPTAGRGPATGRAWPPL